MIQLRRMGETSSKNRTYSSILITLKCMKSQEFGFGPDRLFKRKRLGQQQGEDQQR